MFTRQHLFQKLKAHCKQNYPFTEGWIIIYWHCYFRLSKETTTLLKVTQIAETGGSPWVFWAVIQSKSSGDASVAECALCQWRSVRRVPAHWAHQGGFCPAWGLSCLLPLSDVMQMSKESSFISQLLLLLYIIPLNDMSGTVTFWGPQTTPGVPLTGTQMQEKCYVSAERQTVIYCNLHFISYTQQTTNKIMKF